MKEYLLSTFVKYLNKCFNCKHRFKDIQRRSEISKEGWIKVQQDIDIANIVKEIRTLRFIVKTILPSY
jgi:hypothetical protein